MICAHCQSIDITLGISGQKQLSTGQLANYYICKTCCNGVTFFTPHKPSSVNERRAFWQIVDDFLEKSSA